MNNIALLCTMVWLLMGCSHGGGVEPDMLPRDMSDSGPDMLRQRITLRDDADGTRRLFDTLAGAPCGRQPICTDCQAPDWLENPLYCVPMGFWQGLPAALGNFELPDWFEDSACQERPVYGLRKRYADKGARPIWAYDFRESERTARVFQIEKYQFRSTLHRKDAEGHCARASDRDIAEMMDTFVPYEIHATTDAGFWVPWSEAQKFLRGVHD